MKSTWRTNSVISIIILNNSRAILLLNIYVYMYIFVYVVVITSHNKLKIEYINFKKIRKYNLIKPLTTILTFSTFFFKTKVINIIKLKLNSYPPIINKYCVILLITLFRNLPNLI